MRTGENKSLQLTYKAEWYGRELIKIDRWFPSSKRCSSCGHIVEKMPLNIREWDCPQCKTHHDRDINASINILAAGLAVERASRSWGKPRQLLHLGRPQDRTASPRPRWLVCGATVRPEQSKSVKAGAKNSSRKGKKQKPK